MGILGLLSETLIFTFLGKNLKKFAYFVYILSKKHSFSKNDSNTFLTIYRYFWLLSLFILFLVIYVLKKLCKFLITVRNFRKRFTITVISKNLNNVTFYTFYASKKVVNSLSNFDGFLAFLWQQILTR